MNKKTNNISQKNETYNLYAHSFSNKSRLNFIQYNYDTRKFEKYHDSITNLFFPFCNENVKLQSKDTSYRMLIKDISYRKISEIYIVRVVLKNNAIKVYTNYLIGECCDDLCGYKKRKLHIWTKEPNIYFTFILKRQDSIIYNNPEIITKFNQMINKADFWNQPLKKRIDDFGHLIIIEGCTEKKYHKIKRMRIGDSTCLRELKDYFLKLAKI